MCTCDGKLLPLIDWADMGRTFVDHPIAMSAIIGIPLALAWVITEIGIRRGNRSDLRQQRMYERQETVSYISTRDKTLLRPSQTPATACDELLRSMEPSMPTLTPYLLYASQQAEDSKS